MEVCTAAELAVGRLALVSILVGRLAERVVVVVVGLFGVCRG
jgi:hypothetical protein